MKLLLLTIFGLSSLFSFGQIRKSDFLLGGSAGFGYNNQTGNGYSNSNLSPVVQFAYKENRTLGFSFGLDYLSSSNSINKQQVFSLSPEFQLNQYHPIKGKLGWYLSEYIGSNFSSSVTEDVASGQKTESNYTTVYLGITPGMYFSPDAASRWLLFASLGGANVSYGIRKGDSGNWSAQLSLFQRFEFGFVYAIRK